MPDSAADKRRALEASGTFNSRFAAVRHPLFQKDGFFDPQDLLQLKYETLRAVEKDGCSIARAAGEFGLSRPTIYQAQEQLAAGGLEGLLPRKRGPRGAHKLTAEVRSYLQVQAALEPRPNAARQECRTAFSALRGLPGSKIGPPQFDCPMSHPSVSFPPNALEPLYPSCQPAAPHCASPRC